MAYNRWRAHELYHHGIKGMRWGVRRDRPHGGGKYIRKMKRDLTLLNEHEYNTTRKTLKRDVKLGKIDYGKYERGIAKAKDDYKNKKDEIKYLRQTKTKAETKKDFSDLRSKAIKEVPHYRIKSGIKTANKIITGIAVGSLAISASAYAVGVASIASIYGAGYGVAYGTAAVADLAGAGAYAGASHYVRTRVASKLS